ncbi:MAG: glycerol-3-phosphate acyltransferase, partial [Promethearchaeota archaeon]
MTPIEIVLLILSLILGYLIGTINPGYLIGRMKGIDLREVGTKNPGTSNAWLILGKKYGILTAFYDISKSFIACVVSVCFLGLNAYFAQFSGIIAIVGHCFPFYLKFRGGKGVATSLGMLL